MEALAARHHASYHRFPQLVLEMVDMIECDLQLAAVLCGERFVPLFLPFADLDLGSRSCRRP